MRRVIERMKAQDAEIDELMWSKRKWLPLIAARLSVLLLVSFSGGVVIDFFGFSFIWIIPMSCIGYFVERSLVAAVAKLVSANRGQSPGLRWWEIVAFALPRAARKEIYDNLIDEVKKDWINAKAKGGSPMGLALVKFALSVQVVWYFASTFAVAATGALGKLVFGFWRFFGN